MNKRKLHHLWTRIRPLKPWYFLVAAALCLTVAAFALRANNNHMGELRAAVYEADKNNGDIQTALTDLQQYVTNHMNTGLSEEGTTVYPPIQLKYTYDRLREANAKASNEQVYMDAQVHCEAQNSADFSGRNRVPCIEQYVESHGVAQKEVQQALYKFDFVAPIWSPDLAGYSLLLGFLFLFIGIGWWAIRRWLKSLV